MSLESYTQQIRKSIYHEKFVSEMTSLIEYPTRYTNKMSWFTRINEKLCVLLGSAPMHYLWPLLLTWFNFNPSMDK